MFSYPSVPSASSQAIPAVLNASKSLSGGSVSALRLKVADEFHIDPPVSVAPGLAPAALSGQPMPAPLDLGLEREVMQAPIAGGTTDASRFFGNAPPERTLADPTLQRYLDMGFNRAQASLSVAFCSITRASEDKAIEFANNLSQLSAMGFSLSRSAGALVKFDNDVNRATEACLSAA